MIVLGLGAGPDKSETSAETPAAPAEIGTEEVAETDVGSTIETVIYSIDYAAEVLGDLLD